MKKTLSILLATLAFVLLPRQEMKAQNIPSPYYQVINDVSSFEYYLPGWMNGKAVHAGDTLYVGGLKDGASLSSLRNIPTKATVVWVHYKSMGMVGYNPTEYRDTVECVVAGIGDHAFKDCTSLTSVSLPSHIVRLGYGAFENCPNVTSATLPNKLMYIPSDLFKGCGKLASVSLGSSVASIGDNAFEDCSQLSSVTVPNSVTKIGKRAFANCTKLSKVVLGEGLATLDSEAFWGCSSLATVSVLCGTKPVSFGNVAFGECPALSKVTVKDIKLWFNISFGVNNSNPLAIAHNLYEGDNGPLVEKLTIPDGITAINARAFEGATCLKHVVMNDSRDHVVAIGSGAFKDCTGLEKVTVPRLDYWCDIEFANADANPLNYAHHLWRPPSVSHADGEEITRLEIPANVTKLHDYAFYGATALKKIEISGGVSEIGNYVFYGSRPERVYSHIVSPPALPRQALTSVGFSGCELVVPDRSFVSGPYANSEEIYRSKNYWTSFKLIRAIGQSDFVDDPALEATATGRLTITSSGSGFVGYGDDMVSNATRTFTFDYNSWTGADLQLTIAPDVLCSVSTLTVNGENRLDDLSGQTLTLTGVTSDVELVAAFGSGLSFADATVEAICLEKWDSDHDGELSFAEAAAVKSIGDVFMGKTITSFNELQYFTGLTSLDEFAFGYCTKLRSVKLPPTITYIGSAAFTSCESLQALELPASVGGMGYNPFSHCYSLERLTVAEGNKTYVSPEGSNAIVSSISMRLVVGCNTTVIPDGVTEIGQGAFMGMKNLTRITFPPSVTLIDQEAFNETGLREVDIPATVDCIWGSYTFGECLSLQKVTVHWPEPLELPYGNPFCIDDSQERVTATLYVPAGTKALYAEDYDWGMFPTIIEMAAAKPGDANGDGGVDVGDVMAVINVMAQGSPSPADLSRTDINGDGHVDVGDVMAIINIMAKK